MLTNSSELLTPDGLLGKKSESSLYPDWGEKLTSSSELDGLLSMLGEKSESLVNPGWGEKMFTRSSQLPTLDGFVTIMLGRSVSSSMITRFHCKVHKEDWRKFAARECLVKKTKVA